MSHLSLCLYLFRANATARGSLLMAALKWMPAISLRFCFQKLIFFKRKNKKTNIYRSISVTWNPTGILCLRRDIFSWLTSWQIVSLCLKAKSTMQGFSKALMQHVSHFYLFIIKDDISFNSSQFSAFWNVFISIRLIVCCRVSCRTLIWLWLCHLIRRRRRALWLACVRKRRMRKSRCPSG